MNIYPILKNLSKSQIILVISITLIFLAFLISIIVITLLVLKKKKNNKVNLETNSFVKNLIEYLGGFQNILKADNVQKRLTLKLKDLNLINKNELINLKIGASLVNDEIKFIFKDNALDIIKLFLQKFKESKR